MPDTWMTNLTHFIDEHGNLAEDRVGHLARHLARIVESATARRPRAPFHSAIQCRRRPGHVSCPGRILIHRTEIPLGVNWECPWCGDNGHISGWENTHWDLRRCREGEDDDVMIGVAISTEHYAALRAGEDHPVIDCPAVIAGAIYHDGEIVLSGNASELDEFQGVIAAEANRTKDLRRQALFDEISEGVEAALHEHDDSHD